MTDPEPSIEWVVPAARNDVRLGRLNGLLVAEWPGIGRAVASRADSTVTFHPEPGVSIETVRKFRVTTLMACERYLNGALSLHGSAVCLPSGAVVLVGDSGAGKSTTAMALVEHEGGAFMADDVVPVDLGPATALVHPVEDTFWLTGDTCASFRLSGPISGKLPCAPSRRATHPTTLQAVIHLTFDDSAAPRALERLHGRETFVALSRAHFSFPWETLSSTLADFEVRERLAALAPVFRLRRPHSLGSLESIAHTIAQCIANLPTSGARP